MAKSGVNLGRLERDIRRQQNRDRSRLRGAIIGRHLLMPVEHEIDRHLRKEGGSSVGYRQAGQLALVYIFGPELREHRGKTYFNSTHIDAALKQAPKSATIEAVVSRSELGVVKAPLPDTTKGSKQFWLTAIALKAVEAGSEQPIDMKREELAISNHLFLEANETTGAAHLWLGTVLAPGPSAALEATELLEDIIPPQLKAEPVGVVPWRD